MKKICFLINLSIIFIITVPSQATPLKAIWRREIFIGCNSTHYYSYLIERNQPGSYYWYTDSVFLCKYNIKTGEIEEKILVRSILHEDTTTEGNWVHREKIKEPLNTEKYLIENKISYAFPSDVLDQYKIIINKKGMFLERNKKRALLMASKNLEKYMKWIDENAKVITYYKTDTHFYFIVQYGAACYDTDFYQSIVVVNSSAVKNAEKKLQQGVGKVDDTGWTQEGVDAIVNANNQFAFDLYSQFRKEYKHDNIFFSPYSISVALTMTYEGAKGKTAEEMQSVLHIPKDANLRRPNFAKIINEINKPDKKYKLLTANALWAQKDYKFLEEYTSSVEKYYGGKVTNLDFVDAGEREKSRQIINTWVEEQTSNKIKDLIPKGVLNAYTRLVLTNAIYFKGTWVLQFDPKDTKAEDFTTLTGQTVKVPMMRLIGEGVEFNYAETNEIQILEMPYDGEDLSMLILLPKENKLDDLEESITPEKLSKWRNMLKKQRVDIYIPRFKFETKYFMANALKEMGMPSAFNPRLADFSGMDGTRNLMIQNVIHQAFVEVNEEGTEAAAATGVVVGITAVRITPVFRADRPFIFIIQQKDTGNILFLGRVSDPRK